jgi:hypothetical protein
MIRRTLGGAEGVAPSLELATKLVRPYEACWILGLYPEAGEAAGTFQARTHPNRDGRPSGPALDPDRSSSEAARRARTKVRRYTAANRLDRLVTLTYRGDGQHNEHALRHDLGLFMRGLRNALGGDPIPYVWVPEWHKSDHGLHAHVALGRFVRQSLIADVWDHGFVHIKRLARGETAGTLSAARRAARYLSKYIAKTFDHPRTARLHRYEVGQGFLPRAERITAPTWQEARRLAAQEMGRAPAIASLSDDWDGWKGPHAVWLGWDD